MIFCVDGWLGTRAAHNPAGISRAAQDLVHILNNCDVVRNWVGNSCPSPTSTNFRFGNSNRGSLNQNDMQTLVVGPLI